MRNAPAVSFVVPVYRNRETLEPLCQAIAAMAQAAWPGERIEVLLVDDASPDGAWNEIRRLAAGAAWVRGLRLAANGGQHRAVMAGFVEARGACLVSLDGDLQDPPAAAAALRAALDGVDLVFAGRRGRYEKLTSLATSALYRSTLLPLIGLPRDAGMYFAATSEARDRLVAAYGDPPQVIGLIGGARLRTRSIPVERAARTVGASAYTFAKRLRSAYRVWAAFQQARRRGPSEGAATLLRAAIAERTPEAIA